jgi:MFS family permease
MTTTESAKPGNITAYAWYALGLLFLVYIFNFIDRILIVSLFGSLQKEFHFNNLEVQLLGSLAFVLFYTALGMPAGYIADNHSRKGLIAFGLVLWSVASGCSGFAQNFTQLFICRLLVGVGEATLGPAATSLLSDFFPLRMRATVQAMYYSAIALGSGLALLFGTSIDQSLGWRWAFFLIGFPGALLAIPILLLREPKRGIQEQAAIAAQPPMQKTSWLAALRNPALLLHIAGYSFYVLASNSLTFQVPSYLAKNLQMSGTTVLYTLAVFTITLGLAGTVLGGSLADYFKKSRRGGRLFTAAAFAAVSCLLWVVLLQVQQHTVVYAVYGLLVLCSLVWLGPASADVHDIVGPGLRGFGTAVYFFAVNVIGYGIAQPLMGYLADANKAAGDAMYYRNALWLCPVSLGVAVLLLFAAGRQLEKGANR